MTDNLSTYDAVVSTDSATYRVHNKHGSLLTLKQPDGRCLADKLRDWLWCVTRPVKQGSM